MFKLIKWGSIGAAVLVLGGALFLGRDLFSYASTSGKMIRTAVKDSIPVQLEIQRARDLLDDLIPEMHANLRLVAKEEVEVGSLEKEVSFERGSVARERGNIQKLRETLTSVPTAASAEGSQKAEGAQKDVVENLSQRFERFRTGELLLSGKEKLLSNRRKSLQAAIQKLEKTRLSRMELAAQIEGLEGQFRLIQAQGTPSSLRLDETKLAQTQRVLGDLKKRLEISQRVLEREASFEESFPAPLVTPETLAQDIDSYFGKAGKTSTPAPEAASAPHGGTGAVAEATR